MGISLDTRRRSLADQLVGVVDKADAFLLREDADPEGDEYKALREERDSLSDQLADMDASKAARLLALTRPKDASGEQLSPMRTILREYDRGNSPRFGVDYDLDQLALRELQTGDPYFTPTPTRIQVANFPVITPSLDVVRKVAVGSNGYDFVVPPPPVPAAEVAEGAKKPTVTWLSTRVEGTLLTDAHILDVSRQTLEDDASAERTLRAWLVDGVRLQQDAKVQNIIATATGTQTATGATIAEGLRNGKSTLAADGINATAAYVNPADGAALDLAAYAVNGELTGVTTAWGMRIIESPAIAVGAPIVGAMGQAVYFLYRNSISTYLTDSGMTDEAVPRDRFSHNLIGILAEGRSRCHVVQPQLLVKVTVGGAAAASASKSKS